MPASVLAGTVLYTDSHHPPSNIDASVSVIYLDGPEQLQKQMFGELSSNPDEAEDRRKEGSNSNVSSGSTMYRGDARARR
nr:DUF1525 domain-containing protein [Serratia sp. JUb9]